MSKQQDIEFFSGNDLELHCTVLDETGAIKDLTGALDVVWALAKSEGAMPPILSRDLAAGIVITAPTLGKFVVTLTSALTEPLAGKGKIYYHEARVTDSAGKKSTVIWGTVVVRGNSIVT